MRYAYPACFFKEHDAYSVIFPDLDYLATCGATLDEAREMAACCLAGHLHCLKQDGCTPPPPSAIQDIVPAAVASELGFIFEDAFVGKVTVEITDGDCKVDVQMEMR